jgi:small conductance mechanosensitive channel
MTPIPSTLDRLYDFGWAAAEALVPRLILAILVLAAGAILATWVARAVSLALARTGTVDETARPALAQAARYAVLIVAIVAALSQIGVQTASLIAALGAAGLAIGLALQGTLANVAAGVMLLWLRPFQVGDYIEVVSGTPFAGRVREIGLFACRIETYDGLYLFAPNSTIWAVPVRNHSRNSGRLVSFDVSLAPGGDLERAQTVLLSAIIAAPGVLSTPAPEVFLANLSANAPLVTCRLWAAHDRIGTLQRTLVEDARTALERAGYTPTGIVQTVPPAADPSRLS